MTAGFQCFAQDGSNVAQIDSDAGLQNMQFRQKITQTMAVGGFPVYTIAGGQRYSSDGNQTTFTVSANSPLFVFECPGAYCSPMTIQQAGTAFTILVVGNASVPVTLYVFDQVSGITGAGTFGLQVFNASGVLVADITQRFARIVGGSQGNPKYAYGSTGYTTDSGTWPASMGSASFPVTQRVGFACVQPAFSTAGSSGGASNAGVELSVFNTAGGTINAAMQVFGDNSNNNGYTGFKEALSWSYTAVDISFL